MKKKVWIYIISALAIILFVFGIPIVINEAYKNGGYITMWNAADVLSFYAVILSGLITVLVLVATIIYTKKDTDKQLNFFMSQVNTPFFVIESVVQENATPFFNDDKNRWGKSYLLNDHLETPENELSEIRIVLKNIGEGIALQPYYKVDMFASSIYLDNTINKNNTISLAYSLEKNINDKYVNPYFKSNHKEGEVFFHTYIRLYYKNTMGIEYTQVIRIDLGINYSNNKFTLLINPASPQELMNTANSDYTDWPI